MDDTYNKMQMNPTDSYLEAHYEKHRQKAQRLNELGLFFIP